MFYGVAEIVIKPYCRIKSLFGSSMENFGESCTMHGLRQASSKQTVKARKIVWILLLIGMVLCFCGLAIETLYKYFKFQSFTTVQRIHNDSLLIPSVTICDLNRISKAGFLQITEEFEFIHSFNNESKGIEELWARGEDTPLVFQSLFSPESDIAPSIERMMVWCMFLQKPFPCKDYISSVATDGGLCASFSANPHSNSADALSVHQLGSDFALHLVLDQHTEDHYRLPSTDRTMATGVDVLIHHPDNFPLMSSGSIQLSPGMQHFIAVQMSNIERLSKPYATKTCIADKDYKFNQCLFQCRLRLQYAGCDCIPEDSDHPDVCTMYKLTECFDEEIENYYKTGCNCSQSCSSYEYNVRHSSLSLPSGMNKEAFIQMTGLNRSDWKDIEENIVYLQIYFDSMEYTVVKETPAFTLYDLLANIGGLLGLFLGASLITVIELLEQGMFVGCKALGRKNMCIKIGNVNDNNLEFTASQNTKEVQSNLRRIAFEN